jgi:hypothetical protein
MRIGGMAHVYTKEEEQAAWAMYNHLRNDKHGFFKTEEECYAKKDEIVITKIDHLHGVIADGGIDLLELARIALRVATDEKRVLDKDQAGGIPESEGKL